MMKFKLKWHNGQPLFLDRQQSAFKSMENGVIKNINYLATVMKKGPIALPMMPKT